MIQRSGLIREHSIESSAQAKIRKVLRLASRAPSTPQSDVKRAQIVLLAGEGRSTRSIAKSRRAAAYCQQMADRYVDHGVLIGQQDNLQWHTRVWRFG